MKYCAKCGTQMSDETEICPNCYSQQQMTKPNQSK